MEDCRHQALSSVEENILLGHGIVWNNELMSTFLCPAGYRQHGELPAVWGVVWGHHDRQEDRRQANQLWVLPRWAAKPTVFTFFYSRYSFIPRTMTIDGTGFFSSVVPLVLQSCPCLVVLFGLHVACDTYRNLLYVCFLPQVTSVMSWSSL